MRDFLSAVLCRLGQDQLPLQKELMIGGGFRDGDKAVTVTKGQCREVQALRSNHEEALGEKMCSSLPGFHAITGCDTTSSLAGFGKKKAWDSFCRSTDHHDSLSLLGEEQELNVTAAGKCEAYGLQPIYSIQEDMHRR